MALTKDQVLFYLDRCIKIAEARASFDQESAARRGMDSAMHEKMVADAEEAKPEAEALQKAYTLVLGAPDF